MTASTLLGQTVPLNVAKEQFFYDGTKQLFALLDETARRSGVSRGQTFEDFLHMSVAALSGGQMEDQYMQTVQKYTEGQRGKRGCDSIAQMFGTLVQLMEETLADVLGDLFQGAITYGEAGQFLTPESLTDLMARLAISDIQIDSEQCPTFCDPCCGSGRMLLSVVEEHPRCELVGQDVDLRCVRMTAINLALRNAYSHVIWGNSLTVEKKLVYRTGFNGRGFVRAIPIEACPAPVDRSLSEVHDTRQLPPPDDRPKKQGKLF